LKIRPQARDLSSVAGKNVAAVRDARAELRAPRIAVTNSLESDPAKRERLAQTIDYYREDFPDEFRWASEVSAPLLLANVMMAIDASCRPEFAAKARSGTGVIERKQQAHECGR